MIEDDLKELRLSAGAEGVRARILAAGRIARRDQRVGRWIRGIAAMSIVVAFTAVLFGAREGHRRMSQASNPDHRPKFVRYLSQ